jgi:hypothetical protein
MFGVCSIDNIEAEVATTCSFTRTKPATDDANWKQGIPTISIQDYQFVRSKNDSPYYLPFRQYRPIYHTYAS